MWTCRLCRFPIEFDDVELRLTRGHCICLRCYRRETGAARDMPRTLQRQLLAALAALEPATG